MHCSTAKKLPMAIPMALAMTMCPDSYASYKEPTFIVRIVNHGATGTSSLSTPILSDLLTGSVYKESPVEELFGKAVNHIKEVGTILPSIDKELEAFVDGLIDQSYAGIPATPLTRVV